MITPSRRRWCWQLLASSVIVSGAIASLRDCAKAQITPDTTLRNQNSRVTSTGAVDQINGGVTRGANLFHSFSEFNVGNGRSALFTNPVGIENILTRVTGSNASNILGTLGVSGGNANLFLINPNGITFGSNARLNLNGSFVGTTANAIGLANGDIFSANPVEPLPTGLLNVNPNAFLFNQIVPQPIINRSIANSRGLQVRQGQSLLLVGGDVRLEGGRLRAPGGRVELAGVQGSGTVGLSVNGSDLRLSFPMGVQRADVSLTNGAQVNVRAGGGGNIAVNAQNLNLVGGSSLLAGIDSKLGSMDSQAGDVEIRAIEKITLTGGSFIENSVKPEAIGKAGNVKINANTVSFDGEGSNFQASGVYSRVEQNAAGQGGSINIEVGSLFLTNGAVITTSTRGMGNAGNVKINADTVSFNGQGNFNPRLGFRQSSAAFSAVTAPGIGQGGNVNVTARLLSLTDGGALITSTLGRGDAGNVTIKADTVSFDGQGSDSIFDSSGAYSRVEQNATGQGGRIEITAGSLSLTNGAVVTTSTSGQGDAGSITIKQADTVFLDGQSKRGSPSSLLADTRSSRDAGALTINTRQLIVQNRAQVSAKTSSTGRAGTLLVNATESVTVDGKGSALDFDTLSRRGDAGDAGDLRIFTQRLVVQNGARVSARTSGAGDAGTLEVNASESVTVDGKDTGLTFNTDGSGNAKGIRIETGQLVVQNEGQVTVSGTGSGNPGNLEVAAGSIFLSNQGRLTATTASSEGGGNIGLQVQDEILMRDNSEISASAKGNGNGGNIEIEAPNGLVLAVLSEDSDIIASAEWGNGGNARATAAGVFGFRQFRDRQTPESDFTASSELGIDGTVEINTQYRQFQVLPAEFRDVEIAQGCQADGGQAQSEFMVTGRGGLPPQPGEPLRTEAVVVNEGTRQPGVENRSESVTSTPVARSTPAPVVEAQGWVVNTRGQVVLTASAPTVTPDSSWSTPATCHAP